MADQERLAHHAAFADAKEVDVLYREGIQEIAQFIGQIDHVKGGGLG